MVARAVMKAWLVSLGDRPPRGRIYQPPAPAETPGSAAGWQPRAGHEAGSVVALSDGASVPPWRAGVAAEPAATLSAGMDPGDDDPAIRVSKRDDIVPKRRGAVEDAGADDGLWSSHYFWMGIVIGAGVVLLVKTGLQVASPYGIDWYGP